MTYVMTVMTPVINPSQIIKKNTDFPKVTCRSGEALFRPHTLAPHGLGSGENDTQNLIQKGSNSSSFSVHLRSSQCLVHFYVCVCYFN